MSRFLRLLLAGCACQLALAGAAHANVALSSTSYRASETDANAIVTVIRTGSLHGDEYVRYGTHRANAVDGIDYENVGGTLHFAPGQSQATFAVPIVARDWRGPPVHAAVYLYSSFPEKLGSHNAKLFINHNATLEPRDPEQPAGTSRRPQRCREPAGRRALLCRSPPFPGGGGGPAAAAPASQGVGTDPGDRRSAVHRSLRVLERPEPRGRRVPVPAQRRRAGPHGRSRRWPPTGSSTGSALGAAPRIPRSGSRPTSVSSTGCPPASATSAPSCSWRWTRSSPRPASMDGRLRPA